MGIAISFVFYIFEIILLAMLLAKIKRYKSLTIKDTVVYPLLLVMTFVLMIAVRLLYAKVKFIPLVKNSFDDALGIIKLSFNAEMVALLKAQNRFLLVAYYGAFLISFAALSSLTIYMFWITVKNFTRLLCVVFKGKDVILVLGFNGDAKKMIKHFKDEKIKMIAVLNSGAIDKRVEEKTFLDKHGVSFIEFPYKEKDDYAKLIKATTKSRRKNYTLITFFSDDVTNDEFSTEAIRYIQSQSGDKIKNVRFIMNVDDVQEDFIQKKLYDKDTLLDITKGHVRTYNKYDLNAYVFNRNHSFAKYIHSVEGGDEVFINPDCTVSGCDIHAYFIGFGKVNQALLRDVLVNNQFAEKVENGNGQFTLSRKNIEVDVYDERKKLNAFTLSNGLLKYNKNDFDCGNYLDLPDDYVSHINFNFDTNVEDLNFVTKIYDGIKARLKKGAKQFNFFFVSLQSDMYNTLIADAIKRSVDSVCGSYNFFFVRKEVVGDYDVKPDNVFYMCGDKEVFSHKNVLLNEAYNSAKYEHSVYTKGETPSAESLDDSWNALTKIKQKSNLYAVNGLHFKKDLLGINGLNYKEKYNPNNVKPVGDEDIDRLIAPHKSFEAVDVLAFVEHERWNAFELANGVLPMKKSLFFELNKGAGKDAVNQTADGYHLCIASAKGLVEYYHLFKEKGFNGANVIAYDYDAMNNFMEHHRIMASDADK